MIFGKFFDKNFKHYVEKGDKYLKEERYADARHAFLQAMEKFDGRQEPADELRVREGLRETGNRLAALNISEAEYAISRREPAKAGEHLRLALELAEDDGLREIASRLQKQSGETVEPQQPHVSGGHCGGCAPQAVDAVDDQDLLVAEDRFGFLIQTLPESLVARYEAMGERFAAAYLAAHDGDAESALQRYEELRASQDNDILMYEMAIIHFRNDKYRECEKLLQRAVEVNPLNELARLGMVQLLLETGRAAESVPLLEKMVADDVMAGQASLMLADVFLYLGEEEKGMDILLSALGSPGLAKGAAERLVPLFLAQNRQQEAAHLKKTYLKGCC